MQIYPDGFTPYYTLQETDFQFTGGLRGETAGWNIDLSSTYGRNYVKNGAENTRNASLGPSSPTEFKTFHSAFDQWTTNLDLTSRAWKRLVVDKGHTARVGTGGRGYT